MAEYFARITMEATEDNPNFAGEISTHYIQKGSYVLDAKQYEKGYGTGWSRRHFAERYIKEYARDEKYWTLKEAVVVERRK